MEHNAEVAVRNGKRYVVFPSSEPFIATGQDFLDLTGWGFEHSTSLYVLEESAFAREFYDLSTGLAGEILQKAATYGIRLAIVGAFDTVKSKRFRELMGEANRGHQLHFTESHDEAVAWLVQ